MERGCLRSDSEDQIVATPVPSTSVCCNPQERGKKSELTGLKFLPPCWMGERRNLRFSRISQKPLWQRKVSPELRAGEEPGCLPICNPQHFLPLMNYSRPWPGGRSIMQEAEAQAGPSFQLTDSAPSSRVVLCA